MRRLASLPLAMLVLTACPAGSDPVATRSSALGATEGSRLLRWGAGPGEVGLARARSERLAEGPSALALDSSGAVLLLDRLNGRVLRVPDLIGEPEVAATVRADYEDLAVGPDGAIALFSPLRANVGVVDGSGTSPELAVPDAIEDVVGLSLGPSRQVTLFTALQESFRIGSPSLPQAVPSILHTKREGAARLETGAGALVRRDSDGRLEVRLVSKSGAAAFDLPVRGLSARVVGVVGRAICLRVEREDPASPATVLRRALCVDAVTHETLLDEELGAPGLYVPRRELAVGGSPPRLVFARPEDAGLRLIVRPIAATGGGR